LLPVVYNSAVAVVERQQSSTSIGQGVWSFSGAEPMLEPRLVVHARTSTSDSVLVANVRRRLPLATASVELRQTTRAVGVRIEPWHRRTEREIDGDEGGSGER